MQRTRAGINKIDTTMMTQLLVKPQRQQALSYADRVTIASVLTWDSINKQIEQIIDIEEQEVLEAERETSRATQGNILIQLIWRKINQFCAFPW